MIANHRKCSLLPTPWLRKEWRRCSFKLQVARSDGRVKEESKCKQRHIWALHNQHQLRRHGNWHRSRQRWPVGKLTRRTHLINYHRTREAQATGVVRFVHMSGEENPSDVLSRSSHHWHYQVISCFLGGRFDDCSAGCLLSLAYICPWIKLMSTKT